MQEIKRVPVLPLALTVVQASELLGIHRNTTYKLIEEGVIPSIRLGERLIRIPLKAIAAMIDQNSSEGK